MTCPKQKNPTFCKCYAQHASTPENSLHLDLTPQLAVTPCGLPICSHFEPPVQCEMEAEKGS